MIILDVEQGSAEWLEARLGLASASRFKDILSEPRSKADKESGKLSETAYSYMCELAAEVLTGKQAELSGKALEWGAENEPEARNLYDMTRDDVEEVGIILDDSGKYGASPDGLVGDDGMIEIKCPYNSVNHLKTVIAGEMPKEHMPQVQGNMMINGRQWCDFISFDPRIEGKGRFFVVRVERDDEYIAKLQDKLTNFVNKLDQLLLDNFGIDRNQK